MSDGHDTDSYEEPHSYAPSSRQRGYRQESRGQDYPPQYSSSFTSSAMPRNAGHPDAYQTRMLAATQPRHEEDYYYTYSSRRHNEPHDQSSSRHIDSLVPTPVYEDYLEHPRGTRPHSDTYSVHPTPSDSQSSRRGERRGETILPEPGHPPHLSTQGDLDPRYAVQSTNYYRPGKVLSILWHENDGRGNNGTLVSMGPQFRGRFGEPIYSTIRRMVVFRALGQCSWCFAISTYGGRGVAKRYVDENKHAVVFLRGTSPTTGSGEPRMIKEPLEVVSERPEEELNPMSRLNFGKIYTVEHNVKVLPIGRVATRSMTKFLQYARSELEIQSS